VDCVGWLHWLRNGQGGIEALRRDSRPQRPLLGTAPRRRLLDGLSQHPASPCSSRFGNPRFFFLRHHVPNAHALGSREYRIRTFFSLLILDYRPPRPLSTIVQHPFFTLPTAHTGIFSFHEHLHSFSSPVLSESPALDEPA